MRRKPIAFILDVDGVMTTGQFFYGISGKAYKVFGPHDADGLEMLKGKMDIFFITADKRGFGISEKRIKQDMGYSLDIVSEAERLAYFEKFGVENVVFMGDGFHDAVVLEACMFGIAPANARKEAREAADFITESNSGEGAVLDACIEINKRYFQDDS